MSGRKQPTSNPAPRGAAGPKESGLSERRLSACERAVVEVRDECEAQRQELNASIATLAVLSHRLANPWWKRAWQRVAGAWS
jgi:hypothetical protein